MNQGKKKYIEKNNNTIFNKNSLMILFIIISIIIISVIFIQLINNNPVKNSQILKVVDNSESIDESKIKSDLRRIQEEFTNTIKYIESEFKQKLTIKSGPINSVTSEVGNARGEITFILQNGVTGRILFNDLDNGGTDYFIKSYLPIYNEYTMWYVDSNGIITLLVGDNIYTNDKEKPQVINKDIKVKTNIISGFEGLKATLEIEIKYDKNIDNVVINGEKILGMIKNDNTYVIIKEVSKNGDYNIVVFSEDGSVNKSIVNVTQVNKNMQ